MPKVVITGVPSYDGTYELAVPFTTRDWRTIKRVSGIRPLEFVDAIRTGDVELSLALALNALRQAGRGDIPPEVFDAADSGALMVDFADEEPEVETRPPDSQTPTGSASSAGDGEDASVKSEPSGAGSSATGDQSEPNLRAIGSLG